MKADWNIFRTEKSNVLWCVFIVAGMFIIISAWGLSCGKRLGVSLTDPPTAVAPASLEPSSMHSPAVDHHKSGSLSYLSDTVQSRDFPWPMTNRVKSQYTLEILHEWYWRIKDDETIWGLLSEIETKMTLDEHNKRIMIGLMCVKHLDEAKQIILDHMPDLRIPVDAFVFDVQKIFYLHLAPRTFHCIPPEVVDPGTGVSTPGFGGLYRNVLGVAYVYLLKPSQELGESLARDEFGSEAFERLREVRVLQGQFTWEQLREWYDVIRSDVEMPDPRPFFVDLNLRNNRITIKIADEDYDYATAMIEDELSRLGIPRNAVIFVANWD